MRTKEEILEYNKQYKLRNKDKVAKHCAKYYQLHKKEISKRSRIATIKEHGLTLDQYDVIFNKQNGKCVICGRHQSELKLTLAVDHDHISGKVRGLLCNTCNRGIGYLHDDINLLEKAIQYIKTNR
jgi:hypothetical protein